MRRDGGVEALGRLGVADAEPEMVYPAVGDRGLALAVDGLDAVAVRVEQEAAVVRRPVDRARAGRAVVGMARIDAGLPERVDVRPVGRAEADVQATRHRVLGVRRPDVEVLPFDQLGVRMARLDAQRGEDGAVEALRGGEVGDGEGDVVEHPAEATVAGIAPDFVWPVTTGTPSMRCPTVRWESCRRASPRVV